MESRISVVGMQYLKEALCNIYWYKKDLKSFLLNCTNNKAIIMNTNWENVKRQIVSDVIDEMVNNEERYLGDIRRILNEVSQMNSFSHLEHLEDGKKKAEKAKISVADLRNFIKDHDAKAREIDKEKEARVKKLEQIREQQGVLLRLDQIKEKYIQLTMSKRYQNRGFDLEKVLYDLFELFDLDPKASFRNTGEQIDGAFTLEGTDYLFEAKWQSYLVNASDLDAFSGKVRRKLDNTLGLFLSINGFSKDAVQLYSLGRSSILLMDGADLLSVLDNRIDMSSLIIRKRRHAAQTGNVYLPVNKILT